MLRVTTTTNDQVCMSARTAARGAGPIRLGVANQNPQSAKIISVKFCKRPIRKKFVPRNFGGIQYSFTCSATSPSFTYMSNPAPVSSLCRAAAPRLHPLQLLLPDCIDPLRDCCTPFPSASAAAHHLRQLRLLFPKFNSSPIVSTSTAAPRLHPLVASPVLEDSGLCLMFSNILCGVRGSAN